MKYYVTITMKNGDELDFICTYPNDREWVNELNNPGIRWIRIGDFIVEADEIKYISIKEVNHESV